MERSRMAVLRIAFALAAVSPIVSAQAPAAAITQAGTPVDSSVKATPVAEPIPNFFKDVQANAFASFGNNFNFNRPASRLNAMRVFDANANSFQVDIAELVLQKPIAKVGDVGFRVDLVTGSAIPVKTQATGLAIGTGDATPGGGMSCTGAPGKGGTAAVWAAAAVKRRNAPETSEKATVRARIQVLVSVSA